MLETSLSGLLFFLVVDSGNGDNISSAISQELKLSSKHRHVTTACGFSDVTGHATEHSEVS